MTRLLLTAGALQAGPEDAEARPGALLVDQASGLVEATGPAALARAAEADQRLDYPAGVLFPGLIDCHTHLVLSGDGQPGETTLEQSDDELYRIALANARRALRQGVTSLQDNGGRGEITLRARAAAQAEPHAFPHLLVAGRPITPPRGHMWFFGGEADGERGARALAEALVAQRVDLLKIAASGGGTLGTNPYEPSFTLNELRAIAEVAHAAGLRATAHCLCTAAIEQALEVGCELIHHGNFIGPDGVRRFEPRVAERLARQGVYVDPTLYVTTARIARLRAQQEDGGPTVQAELERWTRWREEKFVCVRRQWEHGVQLIAGSDAGWMYTNFGELAREIADLAEVGLPTREALAAGTTRAARALRLEQQAGRLAPGYQADLLVLSANPIESLAALHSPLAVFRRGRPVPSASNPPSGP